MEKKKWHFPKLEKLGVMEQTTKNVMIDCSSIEFGLFASLEGL
jgi:hypothetical protein